MEQTIDELRLTNNRIDDLLGIQQELSNAENELIALQVRFVHKCRENEDLKSLLEKKTASLSKKRCQSNLNLEKYNSIEYHYNKLFDQHVIYSDALSKQQHELEVLRAQVEHLNAENIGLKDNNEKLEANLLEQEKEMKIKSQQLIKEHHTSLGKIREEMNAKWEEMKSKLESTTRYYSSQLANLNDLNAQMDTLKSQTTETLNEKSALIDHKESVIKQLEIEINCLKSKLDEASLHLNETKNSRPNQVKEKEMHSKLAKQAEEQIKELSLSYEASLLECDRLCKVITAIRQDYENELKEAHKKLEQNSTRYQNDVEMLTKRQGFFQVKLRKLVASFCEHQEKHEQVYSLFNDQTLACNQLRSKLLKAKEKLKTISSQSKNRNLQAQLVQEKMVEIESSYFQKCEHLNALEREICSTRNSLESTIYEINNLNNILVNNNDIIIIKDQTINRLEQIIDQQNHELDKRREEISQRIAQIGVFERLFREEKPSIDNKVLSLEASLSSKTKQLQLRIDQVKELSQLVDVLKHEKINHENQQKDMLESLKFETSIKNDIIRQLKRMSKVNETAEVEKQLRIEQRSREDDLIKSELLERLNALAKQNLKLEDQSRDKAIQVKNEMDKLKMSLKVKENIIESINDSLVLKEAEVARLKARISLIERKSLIEEIETKDL